MQKALLLFILLGCSSLAAAQNRYFVLFQDKAGSNFSLEKPSEYLSSRAIERRNKQNISISTNDLPVNQSYLKVLKEGGAEVLFTSKWLNGAVIEIDKNDLNTVLEYDFVKGLEGEYSNGLEGPNARRKPNTKDYSYPVFSDAGASTDQLQMLGADVMQNQGFTGKGVLIGVFDSGFPNAPNLDVFQNLFNENRVVETYDFVNQEENVFNDHYHGTHVLSCIAADLEGKMKGTAPGASFLLYTTENVFSETRMEEVNWLIAAERADSIGVDIISTSLGYSNFDGKEQDYTYSTLDGNTALITRAADLAASKGILVIASAGNEGNEPWKFITPPSDADSIISVAAVNSDGQYAAFSSLGPSVDGRIKPEVAAKGVATTIASPNNLIGAGNGTSYAAPLITGLAAGLRQAFPDLTAMELRDIILKSGSQAGQPDDKLGYGIPNFLRAYEMANIQSLISSTDENILVFPNPAENSDFIKVLIVNEELGNSFEVSLSNLSGQELYRETFKRNYFELPLQQEVRPTGTYLLKIWNENFSETKRIFIE